MKLVGLEAMNMVGVRYTDSLNPWVDFVVYVPRDAVEHTVKKVRKAMDAFWKDDTCSYTYGELVTDALKNTTAFIVYYEDVASFSISEEDGAWNHANDEYDDAWEQMLRLTEIAVTIGD